MAKYRLFVHKKRPLAGMKEPGIFEDGTGRLYLRPRLANGQRPYVSLRTKSIGVAIKMRDTRRAAKAGARLGIAVEPEKAAKKAKVSVATVIRRYQNDGYPTKKGVARHAGRHLTGETARCETMLEYFTTDEPAENLNQKDLDDYKDWRVEKISAKEKRAATKAGKKYLPDPKTGLRTVDLDLNCLCNAMNWSVRKTLLSSNSIAARVRYYSPSDAIHCRDYSVASADELNTVAGALMSSRRSECLGWQVLIEGSTGLRTEETVALRMDARQDEPGGLTPDGGSLCVRRAKKSEKHNLYVHVHEGLRLVLEAHKIWREHRYPLSPWYLPGRDRKKQGHIDKGALTKALDRLHQVYVDFRKIEKDPKKFPSEPYLTRKYTSHGVGRAFYVLMRRSQGIQDRQIAYELNQIGGVSTLEQVYGLPPEHWKNGNAPKLNWIPKGEPAWNKIEGIDFSKLNGDGLHVTTYEI